MENTTKPFSSKVSTIAPRGTSMAAASAEGDSKVCRRSQSTSSARLLPLCSTHRSSTILPARSIRHTRCLSDPQSMPTKYGNSLCKAHILPLENLDPPCRTSTPVLALRYRARTPHGTFVTDHHARAHVP